MPKRVLHGEGLWRSDKLAQVRPNWIKAEYANLLPLALANGTFEANPRLTWSNVYSYNRPEVTPEMVEQILSEFERVKLLFRWVEEATGKTWGYWVGIHKAGRLPPVSRLNKRHEIVGPEPSQDQLQQFLKCNGQPLASHKVANGYPMVALGFGSGSGSGLGLNPLSEEKGSSDQKIAAKSKAQPKPPSGEAVELAELLRSQILTNCPEAKVPADVGKWAHEADLMMRVDKRRPKDIRELITLSQADPFWRTNILSMEKLRKQFDQLWLKLKTHSPSAQGSNGGHRRPEHSLPLSERVTAMQARRTDAE